MKNLQKLKDVKILTKTEQKRINGGKKFIVGYCGQGHACCCGATCDGDYKSNVISGCYIN